MTFTTKFLGVSAFAVMAATGVASAQTVAGMGTTIDGARVQLLSDGTYQVKSWDDCAVVVGHLGFCGIAPNFKAHADPSSAGLAGFYGRQVEGHFSQFIYDNVGTNDGITQESARDFVLSNAGTNTEALLYSETFVADSKTGQNLVFGTMSDNGPVVYSTTVFVGRDYAIQAATFAYAEEYTDTHRALHNEFLSEMLILEDK